MCSFSQQGDLPIVGVVRGKTGAVGGEDPRMFLVALSGEGNVSDIVGERGWGKVGLQSN